mmetsp:Transcript_55571/g.82309  ORF Transcript_55571/g.82309 Transcript_55571/m.82309 type:complete len:83 (+) Transcript_55571:317-565(+)
MVASSSSVGAPATFTLKYTLTTSPLVALADSIRLVRVEAGRRRIERKLGTAVKALHGELNRTKAVMLRMKFIVIFGWFFLDL